VAVGVYVAVDNVISVDIGVASAIEVSEGNGVRVDGIAFVGSTGCTCTIVIAILSGGNTAVTRGAGVIGWVPQAIVINRRNPTYINTRKPDKIAAEFIVLLHYRL
jgi:hypothetical protein